MNVLTVRSRSTAGLRVDQWTQTCECTAWADGWSWGVVPWEGHRAPDSLQRRVRRSVQLKFLSRVDTPYKIMATVTLTQLSALARRLQQQPQLIQDQCHVDSVTPKPLDTKQERHRRLKLSCQEQHLEIQERLLARGEMGLSCWKEDQRYSWFGWDGKKYFLPACYVRRKEVTPLLADVSQHTSRVRVILDSGVLSCSSLTTKRKHLFCCFA